MSGPQGGTVLVEVYDIGDDNDRRLANVSARNRVGTGSDILIAGFVIGEAWARIGRSRLAAQLAVAAAVALIAVGSVYLL